MQRTKTPICLQAQAEQQANENHTQRLAEIKSMAPLLAKLDAFTAPLAQQGLTVYISALRLQTEWQGTRRMKVLRLDTAGMLDSPRPHLWLQALLGLGFTELHRSPADCQFPLAVLRHGTLLLQVDLPRDRRAAAEGAIKYANRMAAPAEVHA